MGYRSDVTALFMLINEAEVAVKALNPSLVLPV